MSSPGRTARRTDLPAWAVLLVLLCVIGWLLVTPWLAFGSLLSQASFFGEVPTEADRQEALRWAAGATAVGVGCPALVLVPAIRFRRRVLGVLAGLAAAVGLGLGLLLLSEAWPDAPAAPEPRTPVCQEHSGGDNRCPGG